MKNVFFDFSVSGFGFLSTKPAWRTMNCPDLYFPLLLSRFSRVRLCATPSLGFSRQEHWSGLPFPSPMHKSGKWKWSCSVMSNSSRPHGLQPTRLLRPWDIPGKSTGVGCHCFLRDLYLGRCDFQPVFAIYCGEKIALTVKLV